MIAGYLEAKGIEDQEDRARTILSFLRLKGFPLVTRAPLLTALQTFRHDLYHRAELMCPARTETHGENTVEEANDAESSNPGIDEELRRIINGSDMVVQNAEGHWCVVPAIRPSSSREPAAGTNVGAAPEGKRRKVYLKSSPSPPPVVLQPATAATEPPAERKVLQTPPNDRVVLESAADAADPRGHGFARFI